MAFALLTVTVAQAQLSIEITGAGANRIPVAIADFSGDPTASRVVTATVRADLDRSGLFKLIDTAGASLDENSPINHGDWKAKGADALAAGSLGRSPDGRWKRASAFTIRKKA